MRRFMSCLALFGFALAGQHGRLPLVQAAGNADAAHACQHGGYAALTGVSSTGQVITFRNAGECVSYAAHGGVFTAPIPTCSVTATTGCLTFNGVTLTSTAGTGNSITLTGATSFYDICATPVNGYCEITSAPNTLATGGGTYTETNSSGAVVSQGSYRIADTAGSQEGLAYLEFLDAGSTPVACNAASIATRYVDIGATLIDSNSGTTQSVSIAAVTGPAAPFGGVGSVASLSDNLQGSVPNTTITC